MAALEQGGRVTGRDRRKLTPLLAASQNGHTDICGLLLAYGSDVNEMHPKSKQTALHLAGGKGYFLTPQNDFGKHNITWKIDRKS